MTLIFFTEAFLIYETIYTGDNLFSYVFTPSLEALFSSILAISACQIASQVKKSTGRKQNTCLLTWHIINLFLLVIILVIFAIFYLK